MSTKWADIFQPVMGEGRESRPSQAALGQAIIDAVEGRTSIVCQAKTGVGKSFASLIPVIVEINKNKRKSKPYRAIVSTETLILQSQLIDKDLPFLQKLYPGFTFRKLMGRSNYLCLEVAATAVVGDLSMHHIVEKLKTRQDSIGNGERSDVERVIGYKLRDEQWEKIASTSKFCPENMCSGEQCYSTAARAKALTADLVVVNHAILAIDMEMKMSGGGGAFDDGMLGPFEALIVDEAHQLEPVLVNAWTKEITEYDLSVMSGNLSEGIDLARGVKSNETIGYEVSEAMEDLQDVLSNIKKFYMLLNENINQDWQGSSTALSMKFISGYPSHQLQYAMNEYETETPAKIVSTLETLTKLKEYLAPVLVKAVEDKLKGVRKIRKALTAATGLYEAFEILQKGLDTKDGIISQYGTYGAVVDGWMSNKGEPRMKIRLVPLDVSKRVQPLWGKPGRQTNVLLSATLMDMTDGSFKYARSCVGFPDGLDIDVDSAFNLREQQLIYMTPANRERVEGAQYSLSEMIDLINISKGRALVLFTSRKELDYAAEQLQMIQNMGQFPYKILVQTKDADKQQLVNDFKSDVSSVLLATKSFFVGIDVPGESLSLVILAKWPNPRYDALCRQQISHWRDRGFSRWYEREALSLFGQAAGRLIRSQNCTGVVAVLDFRVMDLTSGVAKAAGLGIKTLGSPVTQKLDVVKQFFNQGQGS